MGDLVTLLLLLGLLAIGASWLHLSRARDRAVEEARARCRKYGVQLLDESVGLSGLRFHRVRGRRVLERRYSFEVSIDGDDREAGHMWMHGQMLTALSLPTVELYTPERPGSTAQLPHEAGSNVVPFARRRDDRDIRH